MNLSAITEMDNEIVTVSQFNKGQISRILEAVKRDGHKTIVKNNKREAVILSVKMFDAIMDMLGDYMVEQEAIRRIQTMNEENLVSFEEVMTASGITPEDLEGWEDVELE